MRFIVGLFLGVLLAGCEQHVAPLLDQQLYVWQRQWTPAHELALRGSHNDFSTLRVLALQGFAGERWSRARIDPALLKADDRPLIAVIRLDGQLQSLDREHVTAQILQVTADWQAQGLRLSGVEIDHDAGYARLPAYADFLKHLRSALPPSMPLSITALPAWLGSAQLPALLQSVDSSVLQVHAVSDPRRGLFDPQQALKWAKAWARVSDKPFYLALPAYGVALLDADGGAPLVESEVQLERGGQRRELLADPLQLSQLGKTLREDPPEHLAGLIWFRLPLANDRRAWSLTTLRAVASGDVLNSQLGVSFKERGGLYDIELENRGNRDSTWPAQITLKTQDCSGADALAGYSLQQTANLLTFTRLRDGRLPAGGQRAIGWARCAHIDQGGSHVDP
ncbi:DUF3142 domain-containing protein [Pseudomonas moraviensis]|uniref:DUF3142 domain-containing protein n=1 Tax=Pseudomonas moraviensis TaxID=321662 RepID=UPI001059597A|nr:DUF3142 domain-containing protein [Pseudomonas moraviensis]TDK56515.1 DUF3142 domain-containing protein [Pseudomonas moraviensis]